MNFVGMGVQELLVIAVAAIVIFGPNRLPELASQAAKLLKDLRRMTTDMTGEFERQTGVNPLDLRNQVEREVAGFKAQVDGAAGSIQKEVNSATGSVKTTATKAAKSVNSAASSKSSSSSAAKASTPATIKSTTGSKSTTAKESTAVAVPPKASKKNPFGDMVHFENPQPIASAEQDNVPTVVEISDSPAVSAEPVVLDAVARARQRLSTAGYNAPLQ